jgi:predicted Fe-S protein YdhL (DUF1289 family)
LFTAVRPEVGPVSRRAERFCWAKMTAGTERAITNKIPVNKDLFLTQPS